MYHQWQHVHELNEAPWDPLDIQTMTTPMSLLAAHVKPLNVRPPTAKIRLASSRASASMGLYIVSVYYILYATNLILSNPSAHSYINTLLPTYICTYSHTYVYVWYIYIYILYICITKLVNVLHHRSINVFTNWLPTLQELDVIRCCSLYCIWFHFTVQYIINKIITISL